MCTGGMPTPYLATDPAMGALIASSSPSLQTMWHPVHGPLHLCLFLFFLEPDCSPEALERPSILQVPSWPTLWHFPASCFLPNLYVYRAISFLYPIVCIYPIANEFEQSSACLMAFRISFSGYIVFILVPGQSSILQPPAPILPSINFVSSILY